LSKQFLDFVDPFLDGFFLVFGNSRVSSKTCVVILDADIEEIIRASIDITKVKEDFYAKFTTFVKTFVSENEPSVFAKQKFGFPSLQ
jgi:hypothetical protein